MERWRLFGVGLGAAVAAASSSSLVGCTTATPPEGYRPVPGAPEVKAWNAACRRSQEPQFAAFLDVPRAPTLTLEGIWEGAGFEVFKARLLDPTGGTLGDFTLEKGRVAWSLTPTPSASLRDLQGKLNGFLEAAGSRGLRYLLCGTPGFSPDAEQHQKPRTVVLSKGRTAVQDLKFIGVLSGGGAQFDVESRWDGFRPDAPAGDTLFLEHTLQMKGVLWGHTGAPLRVTWKGKRRPQLSPEVLSLLWNDEAFTLRVTDFE